ncbi:interferon-induced GTP-binding protein Mx-like [Empidonax traillii]|uniref:interferon-induced GTP-binding protein Mx-like n=1 Tax=Empidonax traillii TaxID=164674 RepID=UPI000FFD1646|nr:interferon-induced GTP-binding protein Mx-like [Empidonax traillii]XP_027743200.1 interferon-induced GTP-binding protein Mx-like [Empidonax traillii]
MDNLRGSPKNRQAMDKRNAAFKSPSEGTKPAPKVEGFAFPFLKQPLEGVSVPLPPETEEEAFQMSENIFHRKPNYEKNGLEKEDSGEQDKDAEHTLYKQYEEKIRPCIDLVDSLRALGIEKDLSLPAIAVIGDQSSGKSSVLEALSGVALPRGNGIVTRCPLELKLKRLPEGQAWRGRICYRNVVMDLQNASDVDRAIRQAQDFVAGPRGAISGELISLEVWSPDVPDLTLIDLPGIARVAVGDQPKDIGEQIKILLKRIIGCKETINLVVVPCNVDIATTEALKMAQEVDPSGERTLGILTKPDLVDRGTEESIIRIIQNMVIPLKKGYMIVKCRGQQDIHNKVTLASAIQQERNFFASHRHFSVLMEEGKATIPHLSVKLTNELVKHIIKTLPTLESQIREMLHKTLQDLQRYNRSTPKTESEKLIFLTDLIKVFNHDISRTMRGEEQLFGNEIRLFTKIRREFQTWGVILLECAEKAKKSVPSKANKYEDQYRGREFPGFTNYRTFEDIIKEQVLELEEPAVEILKNVIQLVEEKFMDIVNRNFANFHNLSRAAKMRIEDIKEKQAAEAERHVRTQFKMEKIVYCQDDLYLHDLNAVRANMPQNIFQAPKEELSFVQEMVSHTKAYFSGASKRLSNQIPLIILSSVLHDFGENIQSTMLHLLQDKDKLNLLLEEDSEAAKHRNYLSQRVDRLTKACQYLRDFSAL